MPPTCTQKPVISLGLLEQITLRSTHGGVAYHETSEELQATHLLVCMSRCLGKGTIPGSNGDPENTR